MPGHRYLEEIGSVAMLLTKRLAAVKPEVNLREQVTYMPLPSMNKAAHSGFETQKRHHHKSKTEVSDSVNIGKSSQLGKHDFDSLHNFT